MATLTKNITYSLQTNHLEATREASPAIARTYPTDTVTIEELIADAVDSGGCVLSAETFNYMVNAMCQLITDIILGENQRVCTGHITFEPQLGGSFEFEDDPVDPTRNVLYIGAVTDDELRHCLSKVTPVKTNTSTESRVFIANVMDVNHKTFNTIYNTDQFRIGGWGLVIEEEDEYVRLVASNGTITVLKVVDAGGSPQELVCKSETALTAGTCTLQLASHGGTAANPLTVVEKTVKVIAA